MPKGYSNYPPGVNDFTPDAPWNEATVDNTCECCGAQLLSDGTCETDSGEVRSMNGVDDLCDQCAAELQEVIKDNKCIHCGAEIIIQVKRYKPSVGIGYDYWDLTVEDDSMPLYWHISGECGE